MDFTFTTNNDLGCEAADRTPKDTNSRKVVEERDFISELPNELLCSIISRLILRDSVRTSVLSHKWKHVCSSLPHLNFRIGTMFADHDTTALRRSGQYISRETTNEFVKRVNKFLEFHKGAKILSFRIWRDLGRDFTGDIDRWVHFAINKEPEVLALLLGVGDPTDKYIFRSEFLEGTLKNKLKHLKLSGCVLGPNVLNQLSSLEGLWLVHASLDNLQDMFSYWEKLETLELRFCTLPVELHISDSLLCLRKLHLEFCKGLRKITLSNATLVSFECNSGWDISFVITQATSITKFRYSPVIKMNLINHLSKSLPMLQDFSFSTNTDSNDCIPGSIVIFNRVTMLNLTLMGEAKFDFLKVISILGAFPSLKSLRLKINCKGDAEPGEMEPYHEYFHSHLEYVTILNFISSPKQFEFAIYLLKHASVLKRLTIWQQRSDEEEPANILKRLQEFSKNTVVLVKKS